MRRFLFLAVIIATVPFLTAGHPFHKIALELYPAKHEINATDVITFTPEDRSKPISLLIARNLSITDMRSMTPYMGRIDESPKPTDVFADPDSAEIELVKRARVLYFRPDGGHWPENFQITIRYRGVIYDSLEAPSKAYSKGFATTTGLVDTPGVFLSGETLWIPSSPEELLTFELKVRTPPHWEAVSQGELFDRKLHGKYRWTAWRSNDPMDEIYVVAGPYHMESRVFGDVEAMTYLYQPDPELSEKYLSATGRYLAMYEDMIGPYPFTKFALVENFWQTGYGMPSFTLLGNRVIRLPFIVHTSYGHEILHNWWGNSVYVDGDQGNWCEGLTVYGADYHYKELAGPDQARQYRLETLANYLSYVSEGKEIPLSEFRERHSASTQAVGYGKGMMVFHMLRRRLGDEIFQQSLRTFYERNRFREASWEDLESAFEETSDLAMTEFFDVWVNHSGAPKLSIDRTSVKKTKAGYGFKGTITQESPLYNLEVPVRLDTEAGDTTWVVPVTGKKTPVEVDVESRPVRFAVDPDFDVFRLIHRAEVPATLRELMGADTTLVTVPPGPARHPEAFRKFAEGWAARGGVRIVQGPAKKEVDSTSGVIMILGMPVPASMPELRSNGEEWILQGTAIPRAGRTLIAAVRDLHSLDLGTKSYIWVDTDDPESLSEIARKLPHYGKYSYLVFEKGQAVEKGTWQLESSPMIVDLTAKD